jgi:hypothetical protein
MPTVGYASTMKNIHARHGRPPPTPARGGATHPLENGRPPPYLMEELRHIVGLEVEIIRLEGKRKLSQNRETRDFDSTVAALEEHCQLELAEAMERTDRNVRILGRCRAKRQQRPAASGATVPDGSTCRESCRRVQVVLRWTPDTNVRFWPEADVR